MGAVIRVLWGDFGTRHKYNRVYGRHIQCRAKDEDWSNFHIYIYGIENYKKLKNMGATNIHLIDKNPWPKWKDYNIDGRMIRPWQYKLELMLIAIKDHGEIIYCDWDVRCKVPSQNALDIVKGHDFLLSLTGYLQKYNLWDNPIKKHGDKIFNLSRICVSGKFIYTESAEWIIDVLKKMEKPIIDKGPKQFQHWHDEWVMSRMINDMHNGWPGEEFWLKNYESQLMVQRKKAWSPLGSISFYNMCDTKIPFVWYNMFSG